MPIRPLLPVQQRVLGPEEPHTLTNAANLACWSGQAGDPAGSRDQFAALLPAQQRPSAFDAVQGGSG
jgi:hypothetical protein